MNHSYRLVWNDECQRYVVAPETARGRGKSRAAKALAPAAVLLGAVLALPAWAQAPPAHALPTGGQVVAGQARIATAGNQMSIQQDSQKAILQWQGFDIGSQAAVRFEQPNAHAVALNRVVAGNASQIHGQLSANGQVWLVNPNGVVFGAGSRVNVGGLVASVLDTTNEDFLAGKAVFTRSQGARGGITNQGDITATGQGEGQGGGLVALLAPTVKNDGIIRAQLGNVVLAAGDRVTMQAGANGFLDVALEPSTVQTLVENRQLIIADGGQVLMTGRAADALSASVVANSGTVQARTLGEKNGRILLLADMQHGEVRAAGHLAANFVETSAARVQIDPGLRVQTDGGHWLIDPVDITIDQDKATAIETALGSGDVTVTTTAGGGNPWGDNGEGTDPGDIHVNADISYAQNKLTLNADNDININAIITASGAAELEMNHGGYSASNPSAAAGSNVNMALSGSGFSGRVDFTGTANALTINGADYTIVKDLEQLQAINSGRAGQYALGADIDASGNPGFVPIGNYDDNLSPGFTGIFDGLGHTINGLTIERSNELTVGLFARTEGAVLRNVGLVGGSVMVDDGQMFGALVGFNNESSISHAYATGAVSGSSSSTTLYAGGLIGYNWRGSISNAYATGAVSGSSSSSSSFASSSGGLVGHNDGGLISNTYATGAVSGFSSSSSSKSYSGGLVGHNAAGGRISNAYATGAVSGTSSDFFAGGLVGRNEGGHISNAYATGAVSGTSSDFFAGGLVGRNAAGGRISNAYATGAVSGTFSASFAGGLVGYNEGGTTIDSYWNPETTGQATSAGGTPLTTAQMFEASSWGDDFGWGTVWGNAHNQTTPYLLNMAGNQVFNKNDLPTDPITPDNRPALYTAVLDARQLQAMQGKLDGHYLLGNHIDASATRGWNQGLGFAPVGNRQAAFTGTFDGLSHTISGLTIARPDASNVGLFGYADGATLRNVGLVGGSVIGNERVGSLAGALKDSRVENVYAKLDVTGQLMTGGLVGAMQDSHLDNVSVAGQVTGGRMTGGLTGFMGLLPEEPEESGVETFHTGSGLEGDGAKPAAGAMMVAQGQEPIILDNELIIIEDDNPPTENPDAPDGDNVTDVPDKNPTPPKDDDTTETGTIIPGGGTGSGGECSDGSGSACDSTGGSSISRSIATGRVTSMGGEDQGGLVGHKEDGNIVVNSYYATTDAAGDEIYIGEGLNTEGEGKGEGKTLDQLKQASTFVDWDIDDQGGTGKVWRIYEGNATPLLRSFLQPLVVTGASLPSTKTYDGQIASGTLEYTTSVPGATLDGELRYATSGKDAGTYRLAESRLTVGELYSHQQGYDIRMAEPTGEWSVTIEKAQLTLAPVTDSKTYDGSIASARDVQVVGLVDGDTIAHLSQSFDSRNAGLRRLQVDAGYAIEDGNGGNNYSVHIATAAIGRIEGPGLTEAPLELEAGPAPDPSLLSSPSRQQKKAERVAWCNETQPSRKQQACTWRSAGNLEQRFAPAVPTSTPLLTLASEFIPLK